MKPVQEINAVNRDEGTDPIIPLGFQHPIFMSAHCALSREDKKKELRYWGSQLCSTGTLSPSVCLGPFPSVFDSQMYFDRSEPFSLGHLHSNLQRAASRGVCADAGVSHSFPMHGHHLKACTSASELA